jgi:hypothetical protein
MIRTHIQLTETQLARLKKAARKRRISLSGLIREGVDHYLGEDGHPEREELKRRALALAGRFHSGKGDLSQHHDRHWLEGEDS